MNERQREYQRKRRKTLKGKYDRRKEWAKVRKLSFSLLYEEYILIISEPCYYCKEINSTGGLDRINNKLGYSPANVLSCCSRCNYTRSDLWSVEEAKAMIKAGLRVRNKQAKK